MSTPLYLTLTALVAVSLSLSACKREDKPSSPKPKTDISDGMTRIGSPPSATPSAGAGRGILFTRSATTK
jgi:hypothetical protein